jgi:hypothetical protein
MLFLQRKGVAWRKAMEPREFGKGGGSIQGLLRCGRMLDEEI